MPSEPKPPHVPHGARGPYGHTREQVADLLDRGLTVRQIAEVLHISTQMVGRHVRRIRQGR